MHIVLLVLKIIGIVLLCILGLVLMILAALLFAPFRYEADIAGDLQEKALTGKAYVRWLLRIVSFKTDIRSPKDIRYTLRVFGIPVKRGTFAGEEEESTSGETAEMTEEKPEGKAEEAEKTETAEDKTESSGKTEEAEKPKAEEPKAEKPEAEEKPETAEKPAEKPEAAAESVSQDSAEETVTFSEEQGEEAGASEGSEPEEEKKNGIRKRIQDKVDQLKAKGASLLDSVKALFELLKRKKGLLAKYIRKKSTKRALKTAWVNAKWILLHIAPKKYSGELSFGMKDPSLTGTVCGLISPIYVQIADKLQLYPDFEGELKVSGHGYMKGHIRLWGILIRAWRLYRDKNIRKVIAEAQKVKETIVATPDEAKEIFENAA
ncbi:MAG: hypothetical protein J5648_07455 [Lachnospiraceae bacterium]|nr:hypothetical protein [Lachnospiraceae bacterium]